MPELIFRLNALTPIWTGGLKRNDEIVKHLVEIFCGSLVHPSSNIPMPLYA